MKLYRCFSAISIVIKSCCLKHFKSLKMSLKQLFQIFFQKLEYSYEYHPKPASASSLKSVKCKKPRKEAKSKKIVGIKLNHPEPSIFNNFRTSSNSLSNQLQI